MAEGGVGYSPKPVDPVNEKGTIYCDPCLEEAKTLDAFGYCFTCKDYLCYQCFEHHIIPKRSGVHILQALVTEQHGDLPQSRYLHCLIHQDRQAVFFSKSKDNYFCKACASQIKKQAKKGDLVKIQELAKDVKKSEEFKLFIRKLKSTKKHFKTKQLHTLKIEEETEEYYECLKAKFSDEIDKMKAEDLSGVKTMNEKLIPVIRKLDTLVEKTEECQDNDTCLYAMMKMDSKDVNNWAKDIREMTDVRMTPRPNIDDLDIGNTLKQVMSTEPICSLERQKQTRQLVNRPGTFISRINLIGSGGRHGSTSHRSEMIPKENRLSISGMTLVPESRLLISDYETITLTLVDMEHLSVVTRLTLDGGPFDMAAIDNNRVCVAMPDQEKIIVVYVTASRLSKIREFSTNGQCFTLACYNKKLICQIGDSLLKSNLSGTGIQIIRRNLSDKKDEKGKALITNPIHSLYTPYNGSMYISCWKRNTILEVKCYSHDSHVTSAKLNKPRGMVLDTDGSILVCSSGGRTVLRVTRNGEILDDVLPGLLDFEPRSLALDESTRKLYIAGTSANVQVCQI